MWALWSYADLTVQSIFVKLKCMNDTLCVIDEDFMKLDRNRKYRQRESGYKSIIVTVVVFSINQLM